MSPPVIAAIIAVSGVLIQVTVTYLISRQSANDKSSGIERQLNILAMLDPKSDEAKQLDEHVRADIRSLVTRDLDREIAVEGLVIFVSFYVVFFARYGLGVWLEHGVPQDIHPIVFGMYWGILGPLALISWQVLKYWYRGIRLWKVRQRTRWMEWKTARAKRKLEWTKLRQLRMLVAGINLVDAATPLKDKIIKAGGPEAWRVFETNGEVLRRERDEFFEKWGEINESLAHPPWWWPIRQLYKRAWWGFRDAKRLVARKMRPPPRNDPNPPHQT